MQVLSWRKKLVSGVAIIFGVCAYPGIRAQPNPTTPLEILMGERSGWDNDLSEVAYVGTRCGVLFNAVGGYFLNNGVTEENKNTGADLIVRAQTLNSAALVLSVAAQMTTEAFLERGRQFAESYARVMGQNKSLFNNALHTPIFDDLKFCTKHEHNFKRIHQMIEEAKRKTAR